MNGRQIITKDKNKLPKVVIVGGGFGGLYAAKTLSNKPVEVTLVDRKNHHTFQPLLYQVALAVLAAGDIASSLRGILRKARNVEVILGEVVGFDVAARKVKLKDGGELLLIAGVRRSVEHTGIYFYIRFFPQFTSINICKISISISVLRVYLCFPGLSLNLTENFHLFFLHL